MTIDDTHSAELTFLMQESFPIQTIQFLIDEQTDRLGREIFWNYHFLNMDSARVVSDPAKRIGKISNAENTSNASVLNEDPSGEMFSKEISFRTRCSVLEPYLNPGANGT